jgi:hypothetical protein
MSYKLEGFDLRYTMDDDGIWLVHRDCDGWTNLDYDPSAKDVFEAVMEHECDGS